MSKTSPETMEHLIWEQELDLQLSLLKNKQEEPISSLFPEIESEIQELPHVKKLSVAEETERLVHSAERLAFQQETVLSEDTLETAVICAAIAGMVLLPQLLQV
jgi:hypothetical protein